MVLWPTGAGAGLRGAETAAAHVGAVAPGPGAAEVVGVVDGARSGSAIPTVRAISPAPCESRRHPPA